MRLHGPWQLSVNQQTQRCKLPGSFERLSTDRVTLLRRWNRPTGLTADQELWIAVISSLPLSKVSCNGADLASLPSPDDDDFQRFRLPQSILQSQNQLEFQLPDVTGLFSVDEVQLWISEG